MGENNLIKYEGGLVQRVGDAISVTNKLLASRTINNIQLYDIEKYNRECYLLNEIYQFIKENFWYFLDGIVSKERDKKYQKKEISNDILVSIRTKKYEFPEGSYSISLSKTDGTYSHISFSLSKINRDEILTVVCQSIAGKILFDLADTSIGNIVGIKI